MTATGLFLAYFSPQNQQGGLILQSTRQRCIKINRYLVKRCADNWERPTGITQTISKCGHFSVASSSFTSRPKVHLLTILSSLQDAIWALRPRLCFMPSRSLRLQRLRDPRMHPKRTIISRQALPIHGSKLAIQDYYKWEQLLVC